MKNNMENFNLNDIKKGGIKPTLDQQEGNLGDDGTDEEGTIRKDGKDTVKKSKIAKDIKDREDSYK